MGHGSPFFFAAAGVVVGGTFLLALLVSHLARRRRARAVLEARAAKERERKETASGLPEDRPPRKSAERRAVESRMQQDPARAARALESMLRQDGDRR